MSNLKDHLDKLRCALLCLRPTGASGFEGFVAAVLTQITGIPFRSAASGKQGGIDGATTSTDETIAFECKLYDGRIHRGDLVTKIADFARYRESIDAVWVLAATVEISTQTADDLNADGERNGILITLLDWNEFGLSRLATTLAMAEKATLQFFDDHDTFDQATKCQVKKALSAIQRDANFDTAANDIRNELNAPSRALELARQANWTFLGKALASPLISKNTFGQSLALTADNVFPQERETLNHQIKDAFLKTPDGKIKVIHGNEGCGKSWVVMQSWLQLEDPPITLFRPTRAASRHASISDEYEILFELLTRQTTKGIPREQDANRWRDRCERMMNMKGPLRKTPSRPRLVVILDGLNQHPDEEWPSMIERLASLLAEIGGVLIVTVRTTYYLATIKSRLSFEPSEIAVTEWTNFERDTILESRSVDPSTLKKSVLGKLTNPRLLGVCLNILEKEMLVSLRELDVSRLLFEYIRTYARDVQGVQPPDKFAESLSSHANLVLERLEHQKLDDSLVFSENELPAVADGRFFESVPNNRMQYKLHSDGFALALGIALVNKLHGAKCSGSPFTEATAKLMEPIAALDESPEMFLAGLHVLCLDDEKFDEELAACLLLELTGVQNLDPSFVPAIKGHARRRIEAYLLAIEMFHQSDETFQNVDLLEDAVHRALNMPNMPNIPRNREITNLWIRRWLKTYTRSANYGWAHLHGGSMDKQAAQKDRIEEVRMVESNFKLLSAVENEYLSNLSQCDGNVFALHETALHLLAGCPLASFASELISARFFSQLNTANMRHSKLFLELCRFNTCDWHDMCTALLKESKWLCGSSISKVGEWARVGVLHATGTLAEASEAISIAQRLRNTKALSYSLHRHELFSQTDPCDPISPEPWNLQYATKRLSEFLPAQYAIDRQFSDATRCLRDSLLPLARHRPKLITDAISSLIDNISDRTAPSFQSGLFELERHKALVTPDQARRFVNIWLYSMGKDHIDEENDITRSIFLQHCLLVCFHNFDGDCQLQILMSRPHCAVFFSPLIDLCKSPTKSTLNRLIEEMNLKFHRSTSIIAILVFLAATKPKLTNTQARCIGELFNTNDVCQSFRTLMCAVELENKIILKKFIESDWASQCNVKDCKDWTFWRSQAFVLAGSLGLAKTDDILNAILPEHFGMVLQCNERVMVSYISDLLRSCVEMKTSETTKASAMTVSGTCKSNSDEFDPTTSIAPKTSKNRKQQGRTRSYHQQMVDKIGSSEFDSVLSNLDSSDLAILLKNDETLGQVLTNFLVDIKPAKRSFFRNFALALAYALARSGNDDAARELLQNYQYSQSSITLSVGLATLPAETLDAWGGPSTPFLDSHRVLRLDEAMTDHSIAQEVLAAELCSRKEILHSYIEDLSKRPEPLRIVRAIMVAGFMNENQVSTVLLGRFGNADGFIGAATKAAIFSYQRNCWAKHWYNQMNLATSPKDFWCAQMLFEKIVDGRFEIWSGQPPEDSLAKLHQALVQSRVTARCDKWQKKRKTKLFGEPIPDEYVLAPFRSQTW